MPNPGCMVVPTGNQSLAVGMKGHCGNTVGMPQIVNSLLGLQIPHPDRRVVAARNNPFAVGTECQAVDSCFVSGQREHLLAVIGVKQETKLPRGAGEQLAVGTESHTIDEKLVLMRADRLPRLDVLNHRELILASRGDALSVRVEVDGNHRARMTRDRPQRFFRLKVPDGDLLVIITRDERFSVGTEGDAATAALKSAQDAQERAGVGIPYPD